MDIRADLRNIREARRRNNFWDDKMGIKMRRDDSSAIKRRQIILGFFIPHEPFLLRLSFLVTSGRRRLVFCWTAIRFILQLRFLTSSNARDASETSRVHVTSDPSDPLNHDPFVQLLSVRFVAPTINTRRRTETFGKSQGIFTRRGSWRAEVTSADFAAATPQFPSSHFEFDLFRCMPLVLTARLDMLTSNSR